jgi:hypothetical protein
MDNGAGENGRNGTERETALKGERHNMPDNDNGAGENGNGTGTERETALKGKRHDMPDNGY